MSETRPDASRLSFVADGKARRYTCAACKTLSW